jgi:hypothetical protein
MSCSFSFTDTLTPETDATYGDFNASAALRTQCPPTYLRPDPGGALMPWILALFLLFFHLPACIIRAVRWESAEYLALGLAVGGIALCIQSYISTQMRPAEVMVWMPLTLMQDVGAMLQMVTLIIEKYHGVGPLRVALQGACVRLGRAVAVGLRIIKRDKPNGKFCLHIFRHVANCLIDEVEMQDPEANDREEEVVNDEPDRIEHDVLRHSVVALVAFIFLLMLLTLQTYGLAAAVHGKNSKEDIRVKWCSPAFRDFAIAVKTGNCATYPVIDADSSGIGCIKIPATQQRNWLVGTIIALVLAIVCQIVDTVLLLSAGGKSCRGVTLQRPWLTMFGGGIILIVLISISASNSIRLPEGITETVWIYRKDPSTAAGRVCQGTLKYPGLRGSLIGYEDGIFSGWSATYFGGVNG